MNPDTLIASAREDSNLRQAATRPGRILRSCLLVMAIGLTACGAASAPAPGPIVFSGHPVDDGYTNLMVMNPDGTGVRRLTRTDGDVAPSWSPDGTQVVYARATYIEGCDFDPACSQIWIVDADGTNARPLTPASARSEAPDWSPDGERIVFSREVDGEYEIWVMNAEGNEQRRLTHKGVSEHSPVWSPDGEKIAVTRQSADDCNTIVVMNDDGTRTSCGQVPTVSRTVWTGQLHRTDSRIHNCFRPRETYSDAGSINV